MSLIRVWEMDPNALRRSMKVMETGRPLERAWSMIADTVNMCSMVPFIPVRKPF